MNKMGISLRITLITSTISALVKALVHLTASRALRPLHRLIGMVDRLNREGKIEKLALRTGDEVERLSGALNTMTDNGYDMKISDELTSRREEADAQRRFSEAVVENIANGIIVLDRAGFITRANRAVQTHIWLDPADLAGKSFAEIFPGWEGENTEKIISRVLESGETYSNERVYYKAPLMKRQAVFNINIQPIAEKPGVILGAVVLLEFLTDKVLLEEHLLRVNEELRRANVVKSEFLSTVSHELRTPLTLIKMYSAMLDEKKLGPLTEKQEKAIEVMNRRCKNLNDLINDLLDLSRIESSRMELNLEEISLEELFEEVAGVFRPRAEAKGIEIATETTLSPARVLADRDKLTRALNNLVENALKFTASGRIHIQAIQDPMEPGIARVCVSDTGVGIPEDFRERVFEKFFQVDGTDTRKHGGSGLGLSIAREIVELHGGRLWLDSTTEGEGSRFCFNLPLYDPEKAGHLKIQQVYTGAGGIRPDAEKTVIPMYVAPAGSPRASQGVLIVDDDRDFLDMMREILDEDGFKTHTAPDGISALNQLFSGQRIDVILLDITMPKISGYELCRAIKSFDATRGIPVLMLTAAGQSGQISQGYEAGAAGYLVKPFEIEVFRRTLGKLLGEEPK